MKLIAILCTLFTTFSEDPGLIMASKMTVEMPNILEIEISKDFSRKYSFDFLPF